MTPEQKDLARRFVACEHWRWMPGMLDAETGLRVVKAGTDKDPRVGLGNLDNFILYYPDMLKGHYPDLTDPATIGCILSLVRICWNDEGCASVVASYSHETGYMWRVVGGHHHGSGFMAMSQKHYQSEAEALLSALEAK